MEIIHYIIMRIAQLKGKIRYSDTVLGVVAQLGGKRKENIQSPLFAHHSMTSSTSAVIAFFISLGAVDLVGKTTVKSSAYSVALLSLDADERSLTRTQNRAGPSTEPCGSPACIW